MIHPLSAVEVDGLAGEELDASALAELQELGMIRIDGDRLKTTPDGRAVLNAVIRKLLPEQ